MLFAAAVSFSQIGHPILKILAPLAGIVFVVLAARWLQASLRDDLRLVWPGGRALALWLVVAVAWMLGTEYLLHWREPGHLVTSLPLGLQVVRVLGVGVLGPVAEELIFRGLLYYRFTLVELDEWLTIVLLAASWALLHIDYPPALILFVFANGLLLGAARRYSGSLIPPILMHVAWNLYAVL